MSKLLTEQELEGKIAIILGSQYQRTELGALTLTEQIKEWSDLIQSQKQAHGDMAIGEDEKTIGYGKRDGEYEYHTHRNQLRAEQRERNKL